LIISLVDQNCQDAHLAACVAAALPLTLTHCRSAGIELPKFGGVDFFHAACAAGILAMQC